MRFSHTSLERWRACPQRWAYGYIDKIPWNELDPMGAWATYSRSVVHPALGACYLQQEPQWETYWVVYLKETAPAEKLKYGDILTLDGAKRIVEQALPMIQEDVKVYRVVGVEQPYYMSLGVDGWNEGDHFVSIPDIVLEHYGTGERVVIDFKLSSNKMKGQEDLPFHDQFVGQALLAHCVEVWPMRIHLAISRGKLQVSIIRVPMRISLETKREWLMATKLLVKYIAEQEADGRWDKRSPTACFAWGRACPAIQLCSAPLAIRTRLVQQWRERVWDETVAEKEVEK